MVVFTGWYRMDGTRYYSWAILRCGYRRDRVGGERKLEEERRRGREILGACAFR